MRIRYVVCVLLLVSGCGKKSTGEWVDQLRAADGSSRLHAIAALAERQGDADVVIPALAEALRDQESFVRRDAARALGRFGSEARPAVPGLRALLRDRKKDVRQAAARALAQIDPQAVAKPRGR